MVSFKLVEESMFSFIQYAVAHSGLQKHPYYYTIFDLDLGIDSRVIKSARTPETRRLLIANVVKV